MYERISFVAAALMGLCSCHSATPERARARSSAACVPLGRIIGAVYRPGTRQLILLSEDEPGPFSATTRDLAVAFRVTGSGRTAAFSLDPADPKHPSGAWLKAVYYPDGMLEGTSFGQTLFEADWLLKQYSFGVRLDGEGRTSERVSSVPGFRSMADLRMAEAGGNQAPTWSRFWIVCDDMAMGESGQAIRFAKVTMGVRTRKMIPDPTSKTGLRDQDDSSDPVAARFAALFSELYDQLAVESLELSRVVELAKTVAIAAWLRRQGLSANPQWLTEISRAASTTARRVPALSATRETEDRQPFQTANARGVRIIRRQLHLFGGVDLSVIPRMLTQDEGARRLDAATPAVPVGATVRIVLDGKIHHATAVPVV